MKNVQRFLLTMFLSIICMTIFAQAGFNYQGVLRNDDGGIMANSVLDIRGNKGEYLNFVDFDVAGILFEDESYGGDTMNGDFEIKLFANLGMFFFASVGEANPLYKGWRTNIIA